MREIAVMMAVRTVIMMSIVTSEERDCSNDNNSNDDSDNGDNSYK